MSARGSHEARHEAPWRDLYLALLWRTRRERIRNLLRPVGLFVFSAAIETGLPLLTGRSHINGASGLGAYAHQFGASTNAAQLGIVLQFGPGLLALFVALSGAIVVRNLIGTEASRGGLEAMLASRYSPQSLVGGILAFVGSVVALLWVVMAALTAVWIGIILVIYQASLSLTVSYALLLFVVPLLAGWSGSAMCVCLGLLVPRLVQQGQLGMGGGGGVTGGIAVLPALVLFGFQLAGTAIPISALLLGGVLTTVVLTAVSVLAVSTRFHAEGVLEG